MLNEPKKNPPRPPARAFKTKPSNELNRRGDLEFARELRKINREMEFDYD